MTEIEAYLLIKQNIFEFSSEIHWAFSCGALIFINSTFATKFKNILLNH